jgi:RPA family protein
MSSTQGQESIVSQDYSRWKTAVYAIVVDEKQSVAPRSNRWCHHFLTQSEEAQDSEKDNDKTHPPDYVVHAYLLKLIRIQMIGVVSAIPIIRPSFVRLLVTLFFL